MKSEDETILLRDKEREPTDEVLENALGKELFTIYQDLIQTFTDEYGLELQWRFYKDGKSWLCKVVYKKKQFYGFQFGRIILKQVSISQRKHAMVF